MVNNQQFPSDNDSHLTDSLKALGRSEAGLPDELTRRRHLRAMTSSRSQSARSKLLGVAAAIAVLAAGAVVVTNNNGNNGSQPLNQVAELQPLKEVTDLTPIPFERTEDYVILNVSASRADEVSKELTSLIGTSPSVAGKTKKATTFVVPASAAQALSDTSGIEATADTPMNATAEQLNPPSWGLDRIDATDVALNQSYTYYSTGASSYTYVIDTGVYSGHSDLSGRVISGYTAVNDGRGTDDCNGHGTHVAGTIAGSTYGVAKESKIVAVRVLDCNGSGYTSSVVAGINWVIASHPGGSGVINMSLGGDANSAVDNAVADATAAGLTVVVAAGNDKGYGKNEDACLYSPARAPSALTIGAVNKGDTQASYSNTGSCVDLWAPGTSITSAWIGGGSATNTISGTSMASPHVAGLAARLAQAFPGISAGEISAKLTANKLSALAITNFAEAPPADTTTTIDPGTTTTVDPGTTTTIVNPVAPTTIAPTTTLPATTTTTVPKRGKRSRKAVMTPKEFAIKYQLVNNVNTLVASWVDDQAAEMYKIECARNFGQSKKSESEDADSLEAESALTISRANVKTNPQGRSEATLVMSPKAKSQCWIVAMIGEAKSGRSNVAVVPKPVTVPVLPTPTTTVPVTTVPVTTVPETTVPETTVAPANKSNGSSKPVVTTAAPKVAAPTTAAPKVSPPTTFAPKAAPAPSTPSSKSPAKKKQD